MVCVGASIRQHHMMAVISGVRVVEWLVHGVCAWLPAAAYLLVGALCVVVVHSVRRRCGRVCLVPA